MTKEPAHHIAAVVSCFLDPPAPAVARASQVNWEAVGPVVHAAAAAPRAGPLARLVAGQLALGEAIVCCAIDVARPELPASYENRLDCLVWCLTWPDARRPEAPAELAALIARVPARRVEILVLPAGWRAEDPSSEQPPPALGSWRAHLTGAIAGAPADVEPAGWRGEPIAAAVQRLATKLLHDRGRGSWSRRPSGA
jgi:hypothetical protein